MATKKSKEKPSWPFVLIVRFVVLVSTVHGKLNQPERPGDRRDGLFDADEPPFSSPVWEEVCSAMAQNHAVSERFFTLRVQSVSGFGCGSAALGLLCLFAARLGLPAHNTTRFFSSIRPPSPRRTQDSICGSGLLHEDSGRSGDGVGRVDSNFRSLTLAALMTEYFSILAL